MCCAHEKDLAKASQRQGPAEEKTCVLTSCFGKSRNNETQVGQRLVDVGAFLQFGACCASFGLALTPGEIDKTDAAHLRQARSSHVASDQKVVGRVPRATLHPGSQARARLNPFADTMAQNRRGVQCKTRRGRHRCLPFRRSAWWQGRTGLV